MESLGKYRILGLIGRGGMAVVYRAVDTVLGREVALKTLSSRLVGDEESRERFLREAYLAGSLSHKNIVTIYDMGGQDQYIFMAMELLEGEDLRSKLERREPMALEEKLRIITEVGDGLALAHRKGIVHRDIKPSNIFLCTSGQVKILDFGLARITTSSLTRSGQVMGTPHYISPEHLLGERPDHRSDIFSLGAVFYELLTYQKAFSGPTIESTLFGIVHREPEPIEATDPAVPEELCRIVAKALAKQVSNRYQWLDEMLGDLVRFRRSLDGLKRQLREEVTRVLRDIGSLMQERGRLLGDTGISEETSARLSRLHSVGRQTNLSYMSLVGLRDGAGLERRRLRGWLERAREATARGERLPPEARAGSDIPTTDELPLPDLRAIALRKERERAESRAEKAESSYQTAVTHFYQGDLGKCLLFLSETLRLQPGHQDAGVLEERLRAEVIRLAEQEEKRFRDEVLEAALLALGSGREGAAKRRASAGDPAVLSKLGDLLLAGLESEGEDPKRDAAAGHGSGEGGRGSTKGGRAGEAGSQTDSITSRPDRRKR